MRSFGVGIVIFLAAMAGGGPAAAAAPPAVAIPHTPEAIQHGAETAVNVCLGCHNLKFIQYGDLSQLGFTAKQLEGLRNGKKLNDALRTDMDPNMLRESFGLVPPDLSLMAKAREGGPDYIYGLLTGFYQGADGKVDNHFFPGVKMPDVLSYSDATDPAQRAALQEQARDVAAFLAWAADPRAAERHRLGYYVMAYLAVLTLLLYISKRRIWARLH